MQRFFEEIPAVILIEARPWMTVRLGAGNTGGRVIAAFQPRQAAAELVQDIRLPFRITERLRVDPAQIDRTEQTDARFEDKGMLLIGALQPWRMELPVAMIQPALAEYGEELFGCRCSMAVIEQQPPGMPEGLGASSDSDWQRYPKAAVSGADGFARDAKARL